MSLESKICKYSDEYYEIGTKYYREYRCKHTALSSKDFCEFHDEEYWKDHEDVLQEKFLKELNPDTKELLFIGYNIPKITIKDKHFISAYFTHAKFRGQVDFTNTHFSSVDFSYAEFSDIFRFNHLVVNKFIDFSNVASSVDNDSESSFEKCEFEGQAKFAHIMFSSTMIQGCKFGETSFRDARFKQSVVIKECLFESQVDFSASNFIGKTLFILNSFRARTLFEYANFYNITKFKNVNFEAQQLVTFTTDLSNVSFLGTNITRIRFNERTIWGKPDKYSIFDARRFEADSEGYGISSVLAVYRNLRENYEFRLMYYDAGQFFIKEMELKRNYFEDPKKEYITRKRPWYYRWFSLNRCYSCLCEYGESFRRPFLWFVALFLATYIGHWYNPDWLSIIQNCSLASSEPACAMLEDNWKKAESTLGRTFVSFFHTNSSDIGDNIVRILSIPILGTMFIVLRRRFERRFRH